jgi:hypothetical protein
MTVALWLAPRRPRKPVGLRDWPFGSNGTGTHATPVRACRQRDGIAPLSPGNHRLCTPSPQTRGPPATPRDRALLAKVRLASPSRRKRASLAFDGPGPLFVHSERVAFLDRHASFQEERRSALVHPAPRARRTSSSSGSSKSRTSGLVHFEPDHPATALPNAAGPECGRAKPGTPHSPVICRRRRRTCACRRAARSATPCRR